MRHCKLILLEEGHCLKDQALSVCNRSDQTDNQSFNATSLNTLIQMMSGGLGTTLIPEMAIKPLMKQHPSLCAVHLNEPGPHRELAFVVRPNFNRLASIESLIRVCIEQLEQLQKN